MTVENRLRAVMSALAATDRRRRTDVGAITLDVGCSDASVLDEIVERLVASGAPTTSELEVVVNTDAELPHDDALTGLMTTSGPAVLRDGSVTAVWSSGDESLWLLDEAARQAVLHLTRPSNALTVERLAPLGTPLRWWSALNGAAMVHAAALCRDGRGILLVGDSGAGKSTTALATLGSSVGVLGDDFCIVDTGGGMHPRVHPVYRHAKADHGTLSMQPHLSERVNGPAWDGKQLVDLEPLPLAPVPVRAICSVVRDPATATHVRAIPRSDAIRVAAPSTLMQQRLWESHVWKVLAVAVRAAATYELRVGDVREVPDVVGRLFDDLAR